MCHHNNPLTSHNRFIIYTNFTATAGKTYEITLDGLNTLRNIEIYATSFTIPRS